MMKAVILFFVVMHALASIWRWPRNKSQVDIELIRQHHEKCFMIGLVALAVA